MKTIKFIVFAFAFATVIISCKKNGKNDGNGTKQDTLGTGWSKVKIDEGTSLSAGGDVFFKNSMTGYLSDNNSKVSRSVDGGHTWNVIGQVKAANIAVTNDDKAFFVNTSESFIHKTIDGGTTFSEYPIPAMISDIFFSDNNTGLCSTGAGLFNTTDGGLSWSNIHAIPGFDAGTITGLFMYNNTNAWVVYRNKILHANGDLNNWRLDSITASNTSSETPNDLILTGVSATSASTIYVSSISGYTYKSTDAGATFTFIKKLDVFYKTFYTTDMSFVDANTGYIGLGSRIYKTTDAGNTWSVIVGLGNADVIEIHFSDASHGWAVCNDNSLLILN